MSDRMKMLSSVVLAGLGFAPTPEASAPALLPADPKTTDDPDEDEIDPMTGKKKMPADAEAEAAAADAAMTAALTDTATAAAAAATKAANARWSAVLASADAAGRVLQASALLESTDMSADAIIAKLASFPKEGATSFAARMAETPNPAITADGAAAETDPRAGNYGWDKITAKVFGADRQ